MKVKELMTPYPASCTMESDLATAAGMMWENDCGALPVLSESGEVVGLITDRDICMAAVLSNQSLPMLSVADVISQDVVACGPEDDVHAALALMQENRIRRLPVVTSNKTLVGILSMNDVVLRAEPANDKQKPELSFVEVVNTYKAICAHPLPMETSSAASA